MDMCNDTIPFDSAVERLTETFQPSITTWTTCPPPHEHNNNEMVEEEEEDESNERTLQSHFKLIYLDDDTNANEDEDDADDDDDDDDGDRQKQHKYHQSLPLSLMKATTAFGYDNGSFVDTNHDEEEVEEHPRRQNNTSRFLLSNNNNNNNNDKTNICSSSSLNATRGDRLVDTSDVAAVVVAPSAAVAAAGDMSMYTLHTPHEQPSGKKTKKGSKKKSGLLLLKSLRSYRRKLHALNSRLGAKWHHTFSSSSTTVNDHQHQHHQQQQQQAHKYQRLIAKDGRANIRRVNIARRRLAYMSDAFNTVVDMSWPSVLGLFLLSFLASWTLFALVWFSLPSVCLANTAESSGGNSSSGGAESSSSFVDVFLFSIETQQTIGYGARYITNKCASAVCVLMVQCMFSILLETAMGGIVFVKLSRPKKRQVTLMFSRRAVVAMRDSAYSFMCRVGDMRHAHIVQAQTKMFLVRTRVTRQGELIPANAQELPVSSTHMSTERLLFMPAVVEHVIDASSPMRAIVDLSDATGPKFTTLDFEIVVILEGTVENTGQTTQARTSYLPGEIVFNHVFESLVAPVTDAASTADETANKVVVVDFAKFDATRSIVDYAATSDTLTTTASTMSTAVSDSGCSRTSSRSSTSSGSGDSGGDSHNNSFSSLEWHQQQQQQHNIASEMTPPPLPPPQHLIKYAQATSDQQHQRLLLLPPPPSPFDQSTVGESVKKRCRSLPLVRKQQQQQQRTRPLATNCLEESQRNARRQPYVQPNTASACLVKQC